MIRKLALTLLCWSLGLAEARAELLAQSELPNVWLHTREVTSLVVFEQALWVGSTGGLERYELSGFTRTHHLTTQQGLLGLSVLALTVREGQLFARTAGALCRIAYERASCEATSAALPQSTLVAATAHGAPITVELEIASHTFTGTRGQGLWLSDASGERRLTPERQICTNHVHAMQRFRGELWLGGFRDGLCVRRGAGFEAVPTPFALVNAMLVVDDTLYVAANEGLFRSRDGAVFERVADVTDRGVNGLASDAHTLWVSTPAALYGLPRGRGRPSVLRTPLGSTAIQSVAVHTQEVWLASEDRGALRVRGDQVQAFDALSGLDSSWVLDVAIDPRGTTYAATLRHGLFAIDRQGAVRKVVLPSAWLLRLGFVGGALWVGTQDGLVTTAEHMPSLTLAGLCVHSMLEGPDAIWAGTESGTFEWR